MAGIPDTKFLTLPEPTFPQPPRKVTGTHVLHMVHPPPVPRVGLMTSHTNITLYASKQKVSDPNRDSSFGSNNKKTQNQAGSILGVFCSYNGIHVIHGSITCQPRGKKCATWWVLSMAAWPEILSKAGKMLGLFPLFRSGVGTFLREKPMNFSAFPTWDWYTVHWICPTQ